MSWTQGIALRNELPHSLVLELDSHSEGFVESISWYPETPKEFAAQYYIDGEWLEQKIFKINLYIR